MQDVTARWLPPWLGDLLLAAGACTLVLRMDERPLTRSIVGFAVFAAAVTLLRRRYPEPALTLAAAVTTITIVLDTAPAGLFVTVGLLTYSAALYSPRRRPWFYAGTVWTVFMIAGTATHLLSWWGWNQVGLFAFIFGGAGTGDSVRMRRAYIVEVTERARQAREQEAQRRVIDERLRIARELHDVVAHHIAVISVHAGAADHVLRNRPDEVWPVLGHIRTAADTVLREIKSVITVLRDPQEVASTEPTPGMDRLGDLLAGLREAGFEVRHQQRGDSRPLPAVADLAAYRIVQEALTNAHRYGSGAPFLILNTPRTP
ncbi:signal transduction histidine kinase [Actinoplanes tereljensis]|uniref:histidine kinase n=1 Tax=Paractinoplanes tereljensis TaxID=571912 RepID=A0A919NX93_9ACTN|nr:histidine kinase [Actinoplanes tereljensis]GIF25920.1 hypothetical protein Ate02nite_86500 [Actinoplanes tereljensis]